MNAGIRGRIRKWIPVPGFFNHLRIQRRFFLTYLLALIAPLTLSLLLYPSAARIVESKELETRTLLTQDCVAAMDQAMRRIDDIIVDISRDPDMSRLLLLQSQPGYGAAQASLVYDVHTDLSSRLSYAKLPADLVIYVARADLALDGGSVIYGRSRYYDMATSYIYSEQELSYEAFESSILSQYHYRRAVGPVAILRKKTSANASRVTREEGFLYLQTLPVVGGLKNNLGTAVVHIGSNMLKSLSRIPAGDDSGTFIADAELNVLTHTSGAYTTEWVSSLGMTDGSGSLHDTVDGQRMLVTYARSDYNGWYYISVSPLATILRSLRTLRIILTASLAGILALGVALAFALSRSSARPYEEALAQLAHGGATAGDLHDAVHALLSDQEEMRKALERARLLSRENFLEELLRGEWNDDKEILDKASSLGLNLSGAAYCVAILTLPQASDNPDTDVMIMLSEYLSRSMKSARAYAHALPRRRMGLALCFDDADERYARDAVRDLAGIIKGSRCYAGGLVNRPSFLCVSYSEAEAAMIGDACQPDGGEHQPTHYREVARNSRGFVYPGEIETKMMLLCSGGDRARLRETLDYLYEENFVKRTLDRRMAYALFADMYATLIQIAGTLSLAWTPESFYSMRMSTLNPQVEFDRVRACYDRLTELRGDEPAESGASNSTLEMEQYIREHYANSSLSVTFMAEQFRVSESYFSEYFKRSTGQTFSAFLETTRINSACATLRRTDRTIRTIEEIAEDSGYTNALSFRRAFKKVTGVSPSDYRKGISGIE